MAVTIVSWNIAKRNKPWFELLNMDADIALLQEAAPPPDDIGRLRDSTLPSTDHSCPLDIGPQESWDSHSWNAKEAGTLYDRWPMVVRLSDRVNVEWFRQVGPVWQPPEDKVAVSGIGTIAAARITPRDGSIEPFIVVSMYGRWIGSHASVKTAWTFGYADASVHRIISDLSAFIGHEDSRRHRILAAGDLNILHGYGGDPHWEARTRSVFERMAAIGLEFIGPQTPNGRQAETLAMGEPAGSRNVLTYYLPGKNPETGSNLQLDYVFASHGFHKGVTVRAMNDVQEWGASDHCRLLITVADG